MPTSVSVARQCLTPEAAHVLDEAVRVARRRGHAQTTSLHVVSALLSLPSSPLRVACARARNAAYSPRLQFKALELCLSVSLDRVPSSQLSNDPPVSNSLMAAIKRSQANQRRQPENFHLYRDMSLQIPSNNISCVKVELQYLILSILDDPIVSRVFGEAGFRSSEIKLAIIRPLPSLLRCSRPSGPPVFLCNLEETDSGHENTRIPGHRGFNFPFPGFASFYGGEENRRRIGEILTRGRNPLLVGVCANYALASFTESLEKKTNEFLSKEIPGLNIICIQNCILQCINEGFTKGETDSKFEEMGRQMEGSGSGSGVVVNYGDLKIYVSGKSEKDEEDANDDKFVDEEDGVSYVVGQLTRLLQFHGGKVWLLGAATSYRTYLKFLTRFPSVEKDWDLQILPITSVKNSLVQPYSKSSLMESFVLFGGFFSIPSESKGSIRSSYVPRCHLCNERCEQEVNAISKGGFNVSVADQCRSTLPAWLQMTEVGATKGSDSKTKDGQLLNTMVAGLQKKWDNICQRLHRTHPGPESNTFRENPPFPTVLDFHFIQDKKENVHSHGSDDSRNAPDGENNCINATSCSPLDFQNMSTSLSNNPSPVVSKAENGSFLPKLGGKPSEGDVCKAIEPISPCSLSNSSVGDTTQASSTSVVSVKTDLGLGLCSGFSGNTLMNPSNRDHPGCLRENFDAINGTVSSHPSQFSSSSSPDFGGKLHLSNFKTLFKAVTERVGWQPEAASVICQTVADRCARNGKCHGASRRGDIWLNFSGPDKCGKRKIALALADIIYGSGENFICIDLSSQDGAATSMQLIFNSQEVNNDLRFRGKTVVDYIAEELSKKPLSVVFLENVDKADVQVQSCLSQAIRIGKFSDSRGREVSTSNAIFVTTSTLTKENQVVCHKKQASNYSEDKILRAKGRPLQIVIKHDDKIITRNSTSKQGFLNKRKLIGSHETLEQHEMEINKRVNRTSPLNLDLNIHAENNELHETDDAIVDKDCVDESPMRWLRDFFDQSIKNVVFKPFDFDALAEEVRDNINRNFRKLIDAECLLEIESKAMKQLVAVAYLSDEKMVIRDWVEQVLSKAFTEVEKKNNLNAHTVVKLVPCEGLPSEEQTLGLGVCVPPKIIIN